jgi:hypothetical protein
MNLHFKHIHTVTKCTYYLRHICLSVCLSVHMHQCGFHQMDFHEIWYWEYLCKSAEKIKIYLKSDKFSGTFHEDQSMFYHCWWQWITIKVPSLTKTVYQAVGLSVHMHQYGSHWTDLSEIWYSELSWKSVTKSQICLKLGKNIKHFTWRPN